MELCNISKRVHVSSQKDMLGMYHIFISLACKFNVLEKKSHSLLDDPRTCVYTAFVSHAKRFVYISNLGQYEKYDNECYIESDFSEYFC